MLEPTDGTAFCLDPGSCYDFRIYDEYGDGLIQTQDGFYKGFLGAASGGEKYTKVFEGGGFSSEDTRSFCVDNNTPGTPPPPTSAASISCGGSDRFKVEIGIDNFGGENYCTCISLFDSLCVLYK